MSTTSDSPTALDADDATAAGAALAGVKDYLAHHSSSAPVRLVVEEHEAGDGRELVVPREAVELLARVLAHMAAGQSVSVVPAHAELTSQQAADMLNVSRPYLIKLLDAEEIEYRRVGRHRRISAAALVDYQRRDGQRRRAAADDLAAMTQELGLA